MVEGLFSAAAGMAAQQQRLDAISNDIANVDTTGYQAQRVGFEDLLYNQAPANNPAAVTVGTGAATMDLGPSQVQGAIQQTGRSLDVAINGPGFLEVRQANGAVGLTRNGSLQLDAKGQITTADGDLVQPPITVPKGTNENNITVGPDGTVTADNRTLGKLALVTVPSPSGLLANGASTYSLTAASGGVRPATGATLQGGALEGSNVDISTEMVNMMDAQRSYSLDSEAIQIQEQMASTADQVKS